VDKQGLLQLIRSIQSSTPTAAEEVRNLVQEYGYSQVLQVLAAKTGNDHQIAGAAGLLTRAATHSTDRAVLKSLMALPRISERPASTKTQEVTPLGNGEQLRDELDHDLKRLKKLKSDFEHTIERFAEIKARTKGTKATGKNKVKKDKGKKNPQRKALKKKEAPEVNSELLLSSIESYRGKAAKSVKNKKQIEIIDRFIKRQPTIVRKPSAGRQDVDLSQRSVELTNEVVSTTLADLLISQGKKDRAIEVLKKLIWKFPQKKAIFAARIEELKK
jgi:hypothetical protein